MPASAPPSVLVRSFALWLLAAGFLVVGSAVAEAPELYRQAERAKDLVIWVSGSSGEGSAVVFEVDGTFVHAMTAKHVVWRGGRLDGLEARFRQWPGRSFAVEPHRFHHDRDFATLRVDLSSLKLDEAAIRRVFKLDILGDPSRLEPGRGTFPVGHSSSSNWLSPERPAAFNSFDTSRAKDRSKDVLRIEQECPPGHSGGAVFDQDWSLVGVIFENEVYCRAWRIDWALGAVQTWKYGVDLRAAPAADRSIRRVDKIKVAIVDFDDRSRGSLPAGGLAAQDVLSSYIVDLPRVALLTRDRLQSVRNELAVHGTARGPEELSRLGRLLHADALVTGSILRYDVERRSFRGYGSEAMVDVYRMDINLTVLDVESGRVAYSKVYDISDKRTSYPDPNGRQERTVDRSAELLRQLLDEAVGDLRDALSKLALGMPATSQLVDVEITSDPPGADLIVGGVFLGHTPTTLELEMGLQEIEIDRPGHHSWVRRVKVEPGLQVHANLTRIDS
ncbi:MAG: trypsin-like peptidase domain-containing protein [Acidobacteriota bacterium]